MQVYSTQPKKPPDRIKLGLWAAFLLSALITAVLAIRGATKNTNSPQLTLEENPLSAITTTENLQPSLPDDQLLQGSSDRPGYKELNLDQPVYFLLTGLDKREWEGDTGPGLTDTIIIGFLDAQKQTAGLISIPRDTWVEVPGYSPYKTNQVFSVGESTGYPGGGPALLMKTAGNLLGTQIDYYIQVDFKAFVALVDSVNGVEIEVQDMILVDPDPSVKGDMKQLLPGKHILPGDMALGYARTRATSEGDFGRTKRQQQILIELQRKIFSYEILPVLIPKIPALYRELYTHVETNLTLPQIVNLAWTVRDINPQKLQTKVINQPLVEAGFNNQGQYVLFPDIEGVRKAWNDMQQITATLAPEPTREITLDEYLQEENARVAVFNGTTSPGLAGETANFLIQNGFQVTEVGNSDKFKDQTTIYDYSGKPFTIQAILNIMSYSQTRLYHRSDPDINADIVILLGADWVTENTLPDPD
jgi:LCP family protein required for cell wall assembly